MEPSNPTPEPDRAITSDVEPPMEQQTVREWVSRNGSTLVFVAVILGLMVNWLGWSGLGTAALVAIGLGMVIFIHELGHFLVAKWCDVHVETFSIGFGPPLPGCKFQRGETTYMIALFPLGGYVKMVGEGAEGEDEDNDPRSFKNKAVWQRMAIISAGVFMNLVLGVACFVFVYMAHGVERAPGIVGTVDAGSPVWKKGAMAGDVIDRIGNKDKPYFDDLKPVVILSRAGEKLDFVFGAPGQKPTDTTIEPRKADDQPPLIGVAPPRCLKLPPAGAKKKDESPTGYDSAAAAAQPAFDWGDEIIAASDPDRKGEVTPLPDDPRYPKNPQPDYFEFRRRVQRLAGQPMKVKVRRAAGAEVEIAVPPAFHATLGLRMKMGKITAVRDGSPAAKAGVQPREAKNDGDEIVQVTAVDSQGRQTVWAQANERDMPKGAKVLDPMRLPWELAQIDHPKEIKLKVVRPAGHGQERQDLTLAWDDRYRFDDEVPMMGSSPLAIPQLGLAYQVNTTVDGVLPDSPAAQARSEQGDAIEVGDVIEAVCQYLPPENGEAVRPRMKRQYFFWKEKIWAKLKSGGWALIGHNFPRGEVKELDLRVKRGDKTFEVHLKGEPDKTWPLVSRGIHLMPAHSLHKAASLGEAIDLGFSRAFRFVIQIYQQLEALATGRIPYNQMTGPIGIAATAYEVADYNIYMLVLFLGVISVNLAVVNFLPIPVLDGGHMVFLIYEGLRGKPASEAIRIGATYVGLALIGCLMLFVIYIDVGRYFW